MQLVTLEVNNKITLQFNQASFNLRLRKQTSMIMNTSQTMDSNMLNSKKYILVYDAHVVKSFHSIRFSIQSIFEVDLNLLSKI